MFKNNRTKLIVLALIMSLIALIVIMLGGGKYTYKTNINFDINNIDIEINQTDKILEITDKTIDNGILKLELKPLKKGKALIIINNDDVSYIESFYVHNFGIITQNTYFGKTNNDLILPILSLIYIAISISILIKKYKKNISDNMYQYKNITICGVIIFLSSIFINAFLKIFRYNGLIDSIQSIIKSANFFSIIIFPLALVISIYVIISNIILLKKEGLTWKNMLGIILGLVIILVTVMPDFMNNILQNTTFIDIHNEKGLALYVYEFLEISTFTCLTYLECILLGTIILGIKSAKHIPKYDKDYIIILGCMIKKDGTLTPLLKSRVDKALEFAQKQKEKTNKDITFIPSGGQGKDEIISEAEAMKNYLIEKGIKEQNIIIENKSTSTYENIKFSYKIIKDKKKDAKIAFSTTNYHVFRSGNIAFKQNIKLEGIGAKTKTYFWINAFIREFIATIYSERKRHIIALIIITIINILNVMLMYVSNIH